MDLTVTTNSGMISWTNRIHWPSNSISPHHCTLAHYHRWSLIYRSKTPCSLTPISICIISGKAISFMMPLDGSRWWSIKCTNNMYLSSNQDSMIGINRFPPPMMSNNLSSNNPSTNLCPDPLRTVPPKPPILSIHHQRGRPKQKVESLIWLYLALSDIP